MLRICLISCGRQAELSWDTRSTEALVICAYHGTNGLPYPLYTGDILARSWSNRLVLLSSDWISSRVLERIWPGCAGFKEALLLRYRERPQDAGLVIKLENIQRWYAYVTEEFVHFPKSTIASRAGRPGARVLAPKAILLSSNPLAATPMYTSAIWIYRPPLVSPPWRRASWGQEPGQKRL